ncbi:HalOD1 output domain-containing protein [Natrialba chahannaoensis]|uniref:HalOD1 output domain-containing protein n=1 Tax=Natrialba chahannaoensis TaxID=68911 RepID=UPI000677828C|nr:HalOD1 output domain-containing protein [Natrialba chahannaoensis]
MHPAISTALTRIAARNDLDVADLPPLYEVVDPEALAAVLESGGNALVGFEYEGYRLVIGPGPDDVAVEVIDENR